jgi:hypothetical protein
MHKNNKRKNYKHYFTLIEKIDNNCSAICQINVIKFIQIDKSQITLLYLMYAPYCYHSVYVSIGPRMNKLSGFHFTFI